MLGQEYGFEWVKENIKHCPISNSMDLLGKKFAVLILRNIIVYKQTRFNQFIDTNNGINPRVRDGQCITHSCSIRLF
jgi:DNA-binding HxlR family transcriptional regulator